MRLSFGTPGSGLRSLPVCIPMGIGYFRRIQAQHDTYSYLRNKQCERQDDIEVRVECTHYQIRKSSPDRLFFFLLQQASGTWYSVYCSTRYASRHVLLWVNSRTSAPGTPVEEFKSVAGAKLLDACFRRIYTYACYILNMLYMLYTGSGGAVIQ